MRPLLVFVFLALLRLPALADEWTATDTLVEVGCVGLLVLDFGQSLDRRFNETNAVLPPRPSRTTVTKYFLGAIAAQLVIARLLPNPWRRVFQIVVIGVEAHSVTHNWRLGAELSW